MDDDPVLIGMMYPDAASVIASCGKPLTRFAAESKTPQMKAGMEAMTVGRSWDGYESLLQRNGELAASLTGTPYVPMLRAFAGLFSALLGPCSV